MKLYKMAQILSGLTNKAGSLPNADIHTSTNGEIAITFSGQPEKLIDSHMKRNGFVLVDATYIYRPRIRSPGENRTRALNPGK